MYALHKIDQEHMNIVSSKVILFAYIKHLTECKMDLSKMDVMYVKIVSMEMSSYYKINKIKLLKIIII